MHRARGWTAAALVLAVSASPALAAPYEPAPAPVVSWLSLEAPGPYAVGSTLVIESDAAPVRVDATLESGYVVLRSERNTDIYVDWSPQHGDFRRQVVATDVTGTYRFHGVVLTDDFDGHLSCTTTSCRTSDGDRVPPQSLPAAAEVVADDTADTTSPVVSQVRLVSGTEVRAGDRIEAVTDAADANGILYAGLTLRGPGGRTITVEQFGGHDRLTYAVPSSVPNGTYTVQGLTTYDPRFNATNCDRDGACTSTDGATSTVDYGVGTVTVVAQADRDLTAPTISGTEFLSAPGVAIGEELRLRTGVTDPVGTLSGGVGLRGPENRYVYLALGPDGIARGTVPVTAVEGTYVLDELYAYDDHGNALSCAQHYPGGCLQYGDGPAPDVDLGTVRIDIAGHTDHDPPLPIRAPALSVTSVSAGHTVTLDPGLDDSAAVETWALLHNAPAPDEPSGAVSFYRPEGRGDLRGYVRRSAPADTYHLTGLSTQDTAGNALYCQRRSCYDETYQRLGDWDGRSLTLTVTPALADDAAPVLGAVALVSPAVQPSGSSVELSVAATDDSGYWRVDAQLRNLTRGGTWHAYTSWYEDGRLVSPHPWSGGTLPDGRYQLYALSLEDEAGNQVACVEGACTASDGTAAPTLAPLTFTIGEVEDLRDTTAPTVFAQLERAPDRAGWYSRPVRVDWSVGDAHPSSGIATRPASTLIDGEGAGITVTSGPGCDIAGNCATGSVAVRMDQTAPVVTLTTDAPAYTVEQQVQVSCAATDALSGVATSACTSSSRPAYDYPVGTSTVRGSATDVAGNERVATTAVRVDLTYAGLQALGDRFQDAAVSRLALTVALRRIQAGLPGDFAAAVAAYQDQVRRDSGTSLSAVEAQVLLRLSGELKPGQGL